jgi:hypothetical protein
VTRGDVHPLPRHDNPEGATVSAHVRARLDDLLTIEEVLGAAALDAEGDVECCINMQEVDATALHRVLSIAVGSFSSPDDARLDHTASFATFALREGQIAFSSTRRRSLLVLTDPGIPMRSLKALLHEVLSDLALADRQLTVAPAAPPVSAC